MSDTRQRRGLGAVDAYLQYAVVAVLLVLPFVASSYVLYVAALLVITSLLPAQERLLLSYPAPAFLLVVLYSIAASLLRRAAIRRGPAQDDVVPTIVTSGVDAAAHVVTHDDVPARSHRRFVGGARNLVRRFHI